MKFGDEQGTTHDIIRWDVNTVGKDFRNVWVKYRKSPSAEPSERILTFKNPTITELAGMRFIKEDAYLPNSNEHIGHVLRKVQDAEKLNLTKQAAKKEFLDCYLQGGNDYRPQKLIILNGKH